jgi:hypothetical protein
LLAGFTDLSCYAEDDNLENVLAARHMSHSRILTLRVTSHEVMTSSAMIIQVNRMVAFSFTKPHSKYTTLNQD